MSVLGCAPASLHPTYDYSIQDSQADCRAPFRYFRVSCSPICGVSPRRNARHREERSGLPVGTARALCLLPVVGWVQRQRVVIM